MRSSYWHPPLDESHSLLAAAARAGWTAVAFDRPGYGATSGLATERVRARDQADLVRDQALPLAGESPIVLVGHSLGSIVAGYCALDGWDGRVAGLAIGGAPLAYSPAQVAALALNDVSGDFVRMPRALVEANVPRWFGPPGTYDPVLLDHVKTLMGRTPSGEFEDARRAPDVLPSLLADVTVPIQVAVGEFEDATAQHEVIIDVATSALRDHADVDVLVVEGAGHNLSLSSSAPWYHQKILAFGAHALAAHAEQAPRWGMS
jgi:pimeloyl-ACP methyl ester carboxylesterase